MHIPENYLSPQTCGALDVAMVPIWAYAAKKVGETVPKDKMPLLGVAAAFCFLAMMFNVPLPGGTTGHAVGGTLIAVLFGPWAACISVSVALILQAVLFGDGGVLAIGANCFNIAFVLPFVGYAVYRGISKRMSGMKGQLVGAAVGSYLGINAAALFAAIEFGMQPLLFTDAAGQALYCPYPLSISIPAMMIGHLTVFGIVEAIFTTSVLAFVMKTAPGFGINALGTDARDSSLVPVFALMGALVIATPLGLLAEGAAWGEWGADEIADVAEGGSVLGYAPAGIEGGWTLDVFFPDYTMAPLPEWFAYILSAIIGVACAVIVFRLVASLMKDKTDFGSRSHA